MRAMTLVAIFSTAAVAACSGPAEDTAQNRDESLSAELELALFSGSEKSASTPVISELELGRPEAEVVAERTASPAQQPEQSESSSDRLGVLAAPVAVSIADNEVAEAPPAVSAGDLILTPVDADAAEDSPAVAANEPRYPRTGRPAIIIRGGVTELDPCKRHGPGLGAIAGVLDPGGEHGSIGVMINEQVPRPRGDRGFPAMGRATSRGFGGSFPGGIR